MQLAKVFGGKKFMWDGLEYSDRQAADEATLSYRKDHFEVETFEEGGLWFVYSRRVVKEAAADTQSA